MLPKWRTGLLLGVLLGTVGGAPPAAPAAGADAFERRREACERAVRDLAAGFGSRYPGGEAFLRRARDLAGEGPDRERRLETLRREALLANPLLDFDRLLLVRRGPRSPRLGLPMNWEGNASLPRTGFDDEIAVLSPVRPDGKLSTLYRPPGSRFTGDLDLHWDADRLLFSMPGANGRWQVHEIRTDGTGLREIPLIDAPDVDNYDACYLPGGGLLFSSTAPFIGVPCVGGAAPVANLYRRDGDGPVRRLTFEQDHDWCPTVLEDGRILYLRWEYADLPHFASRILFQMNPDGSGQSEFYGSGSYWPNSVFYARPVPGHPSRFLGVVSGHHDVPRMGELVLFDVSLGRREAEGAVQRIPGRDRKVVPVVRDALVKDSWPKFLHPWPLSDKYVIVSAQPAPGSPWGIYLADVFDNLVLLHETPDAALLEPVPLRRRQRPPVVPDRVRPERKDALVHISDLYTGEGLRGVPRGTVKALRLFTYEFAYHGMGGQVHRVGLDGPWDIKRVLGTVPVEEDGSACFRVPANTPISLQPLDADGKALQLMRSWMTAMPGEVVSCVGCHEGRGAAPPARAPRASLAAPSDIRPWYGPPRGFSFRRELQPVLDRHCVRCHAGTAAVDLRDGPDVQPGGGKLAYDRHAHFPPSYLALRSFVRTPTIESDLHVLMPAEVHADTTRLVQLLRKGHHGVELDPEGWDRLVTWIDLNTPAHGSWEEITDPARVAAVRARRRAMDRAYAALDDAPEASVGDPYAPACRPATPPPPAAPRPAVAGWPFGEDEARRLQAAAAPPSRLLDLGAGVRLELRRIPPGAFVLGDEEDGPPRAARIDRAFWMGTVEVSNAQFARFDPSHDSRLETGDFLQFSEQERGYPVNGSAQPVCRVSWERATAFCRWLSERTGERAALPTEEQWEYACRAGSDRPLSFGGTDADFSRFANLADRSLRRVDTFGWGLPSGAVPPWRPAVEAVDDGHRVSAPVGSFAPNAWGLHDLHGNVAEWTRTPDARTPGRRLACGGSWYDRPRHARAAARQSYPAWQGVYDVGFRIVIEDEGTADRKGSP